MARALLSSLPRTSDLIPLIITLATPHKRPPANLDGYVHSFYNRISNISNIPEKSSIISISGGFNDFLVPSYLSGVKGNNNLHVVVSSSPKLHEMSPIFEKNAFQTTSIPKVWLPTDHLCILWCKQLVLTLNWALFNSVSLKTKQISHSPHQRYLIFYHHLIHVSRNFQITKY